MKKIPTLFKRVYEGHKIVDILPEITEGCEVALLHGQATVKFDGACCAIFDGAFYKRFDAKKGRKIPEGAIPCCDPDPVTGHWPHWIKVDPDKPEDKWFMEALKNTFSHSLVPIPDGTYEAIGPHFQGNPHGYSQDVLVPHGGCELKHMFTRDFEGIKAFLRCNELEGIVFWFGGEPVCKIKRTDFGFEWPIKKED